MGRRAADKCSAVLWEKKCSCGLVLGSLSLSKQSVTKSEGFFFLSLEETLLCTAFVSEYLVGLYTKNLENLERLLEEKKQLKNKKKTNGLTEAYTKCAPTNGAAADSAAKSSQEACSHRYSYRYRYRLTATDTDTRRTRDCVRAAVAGSFLTKLDATHLSRTAARARTSKLIQMATPPPPTPCTRTNVKQQSCSVAFLYLSDTRQGWQNGGRVTVCGGGLGISGCSRALRGYTLCTLGNFFCAATSAEL